MAKEKSKKDWWFKFEIGPWRSSPELRRCSPATRGIWIDCIVIMRESGSAVLKGTYADLARAVGCLPEEMRSAVSELKLHKTADVTLGNDCVTLKSRKYARELKSKELNRLRVQNHRRNGQCNAPVTDRVISKSKNKNKEEEIREAARPQTEVVTPANLPPPADQRKAHPAIVAIHETVGIYPPREIWDELIERIGFEVDVGKLKNVYRKWRARGYNKTNYDGFVDWYTNGIPEQGNRNGTNQQRNSPARETTTDRLRATAEIVDQYPTEAELRGQR